MEDELSKLCGETRCVADFEKLREIGEGTYGQVCKDEGQSIVLAREKAESKRLVALKKIRMELDDSGFPVTSLREVKILQTLPAHENVVRLQEVVVGYKQTKQGSLSLI